MQLENTYRDLPERFYAEVSPADFSAPTLLAFNRGLSDELGLDLDSQSDGDLANLFSGQKLMSGSDPIPWPRPMPRINLDTSCLSWAMGALCYWAK